MNDEIESLKEELAAFRFRLSSAELLAESRGEVIARMTAERDSALAELEQLKDIEGRARRMFEAQADKLAAPWCRQWEATKDCWRAAARFELAAQTKAGGQA